MHIALMTPFSCDDPTCIAVLGGLAKSYRNSGHRITIVGQLYARGYPERQAHEETPLGPVHRLGSRMNLFPMRRIFMFFQAWRIFSKVDFVHLHLIGLWDPLILISWMICELLKIPMGVSFQDYNNPSIRYRYQGLRLWVLRRMLSRAQWVTTLTHFVAQELARDVPGVAERVRIIPNGFDPAESALASNIPPGVERPYVLCAARLMPYKGIDLLLMAWKDICGEISETELVIAGQDHADGHYQKLAEMLGIAPRVRFLGQVPRAAVLALMRSSLFFVFPSRHEAFGIAALEAMSCGKAVLAADAGGLPEYITDGDTGILVPPKNVTALRRGLLKLLRDPSLRRRLGQKARLAASGYRWNDIADSYLNLCQSR